MTSNLDQHPLSSPTSPETDPSPTVLSTRTSDKQSTFSSITSFPRGRPNASFSTLFASTSSLPSAASITSSSSTPTIGTTIGESVFSPAASKNGAPIASPSQLNQSDDAASLILRAIVPHVSVLPSSDCEELLRHKGINGGLLELLRPFGESIPGRVVIRDSTGASRPWDDFGIRFMGVKDGLEAPRLRDQVVEPNKGNENRHLGSLNEYRPARLRTGGDVSQIDEVVERHLDFAESQPRSAPMDYLNVKDKTSSSSSGSAPFHTLYLRRLLSGMTLSPHETIPHPVAVVIAISSRNPSPIEELRSLYTASNSGEFRLPPWVNNEYLRYYVLVHDEDYDDIKKSTSLYEQMKRHFGLHCHLLRLRSTQCVPTDDESLRLPPCEWISAAEELTEIATRENMEDDEDPTPYIFESDAAAVRSFVREMVSQSIIPGMERMTATWNDQVASRRRGLSGRFMSLSKRFTPFSGRSATGPVAGGISGNYDASQGFYHPDAPEAVMRKLADYALMLRDFKLAQTTYDLLCQDYKNDKAWKYYAGANEMAAITTLLSVTNLSAKVRIDTVDQYLENAYYSYTTRCIAPFYAHRSLALGAELLKNRGGSSLDDAARWLGKILDDRLVGPVGHVLTMERIATCYAMRGGVGTLQSGSRFRKAGFWTVLASAAWLDLNKLHQAERSLAKAMELYNITGDEAHPLAFDGMRGYTAELEDSLVVHRPESRDRVTGLQNNEPVQQIAEQVDQRSHRRNSSVVMTNNNASFDPLGAMPMGPRSPVLERPEIGEDGFE